MTTTATSTTVKAPGEVAWLDAMLQPRSVALVGASDDPVKISGRPLAYLVQAGFDGRLIPVNGTRSTVQGLPATASVREINGPVDVAVLGVPAAATVEAVEHLGELGCQVAVVLSSGWAEAGAMHDQQRLLDAARAGGVRLLGPNCLGSISVVHRLPLTFTSALDEFTWLPGELAFVSQSGAIGSFLLSVAQRRGVGVHSLITTGNEADLTTGEVIQALAVRSGVRTIAGYIEGCRDLEQLEQALTTARNAGTSVVLLTSGGTPAGRAAAAAHTGLPAVAPYVEGLARRTGAEVVPGMQELLDVAMARAVATITRSEGARLGIVTISGGAGAVAADQAAQLGLLVVTLSEPARARLAELVPSFGNVANPVDVTGAAVGDTFLLGRVLDVLAESDEFDALAVVLGNVTRGQEQLVEALVRFRSATRISMAVAWVGGSGQPQSVLNQSGIPTYDDPGRAIRALAPVDRSEVDLRTA